MYDPLLITARIVTFCVSLHVTNKNWKKLLIRFEWNVACELGATKRWIDKLLVTIWIRMQIPHLDQFSNFYISQKFLKKRKILVIFCVQKFYPQEQMLTFWEQSWSECGSVPNIHATKAQSCRSSFSQQVLAITHKIMDVRWQHDVNMMGNFRRVGCDDTLYIFTIWYVSWYTNTGNELFLWTVVHWMVLMFYQWKDMMWA